jgi:hypothetical protein
MEQLGVQLSRRKFLESTSASGEYKTLRISDRARPGHWPGATYRDRAESELFRLCAALGYEGEFDTFNGVQREMLGKWADTAVPATAPYLSEVGDDHSPYEFSLQFEPGGVELRLLVEAQGDTPSAESNRVAALDLNRRLVERFDVDLGRFSRVQDLFLSGEAAAPFSLWHAVCWFPGTVPAFKLYLNPRARGRDGARELIDEALDRLGFGAEARDVLDRVASSPRDEFRYFSLDLSAGVMSRVKVYVTHHGAAARELEEVMSASPHHFPGDVLEFCESMAGHDGPFLIKSVTTCVSFVEGNTKPHAMTMHLPIAHYVDSDDVTATRVARFLRRHGLDDMSYRRAIHVFTPRALEDGIGVQSYASYRRESEGLRFSAYLSPELFSRHD